MKCILCKEEAHVLWEIIVNSETLLCCMLCMNSFSVVHSEFTIQKRKEFLIKRYGSICSNLGCSTKENLIIHHVQPISKGGGNHLNNLIILCESCHKLKHKTIK